MAHLLKEGGPAFPLHGSTPVESVDEQKGMTQRDYFAGQALTGLTAHNFTLSDGKPFATWCAKYAYEIADAMLAERGRGHALQGACEAAKRLRAGIEERRKLRGFYVPEDVTDAMALADQTQAILRMLDERFAECAEHDHITAGEAYDDFYRDEVAEVLGNAGA